MNLENVPEESRIYLLARTRNTSVRCPKSQDGNLLVLKPTRERERCEDKRGGRRGGEEGRSGGGRREEGEYAYLYTRDI